MYGLIRNFLRQLKKTIDQLTAGSSGSPFKEFMHVYDLGNALTFVIENWDPKDKSF